MTKLLLITDIPRLSTLFRKIAEDPSISLRIASNLEQGSEEILAEKPTIVFVQTHLSGLSPDILLMHLKKQLGRKRVRFILISSPSQTSNDIIKLYHGHIDSTQDDSAVLLAINELLAKVAIKNKPAPQQPALAFPDLTAADAVRLSTVTANREINTEPSIPPRTEQPVIPPAPVSTPPVPETVDDRSLEDLGVTYAPRQRLKVYSEFNQSFESAVDEIQNVTSAEKPVSRARIPWESERADVTDLPDSTSSRRTTILLVIGFVALVVGVTAIQHYTSTRTTESSEKQPTFPVISTGSVTPPAAPTPVEPVVPTTAVTPVTPVAPPLKPTPPADSSAEDKAIISAIKQSVPPKPSLPPATAGQRLKELPPFIPRGTIDKSYGAAHPGWERYVGQVTEFKVYRENDSISSLHILDRGGKGLPGFFIENVLKQVAAKNPSFVPETTEKKEGYLIKRGRVGESLSAAYYQEEQGGLVRAVVLTWR